MLKQLVDHFIAVPLVGIDVGSAALKVVELARTGGQIILRRAVVAAVQGDDQADALKRIWSDAGWRSTHAALGLAAPGVIVKPFEVPPMPRKELRSALQLEAEQAVLNGHSISQMAIDWHVMSSPLKASIRGILAVVPAATLNARLHMARAAGLRPTVVDVEGLALWNAYWALIAVREAAPKTALLMNVGARTTNLVIAKSPDKLLLIRDLQLGATALEAGRSSDWVTEVRDSIGYARSQAGLRALDAAYVTGGGSGPKLIPLMKAAVSSPVTFWNPLNQLPCGADVTVEKSIGPLLAIAIGLALRQPS